MGRGSWAAAAVLAAAVAAAVLAPAAAQVGFDSSTPGVYLTYCASAGTGEVFTPRCMNTYNELVDTVKQLIGSPQSAFHFNDTARRFRRLLTARATRVAPRPAGRPAAAAHRPPPRVPCVRRCASARARQHACSDVPAV